MKTKPGTEKSWPASPPNFLKTLKVRYFVLWSISFLSYSNTSTKGKPLKQEESWSWFSGFLKEMKINLWKNTGWLSGSGVGPESLHFYPSPQWCWCYWSRSSRDAANSMRLEPASPTRSRHRVAGLSQVPSPSTVQRVALTRSRLPLTLNP